MQAKFSDKLRHVIYVVYLLCSVCIIRARVNFSKSYSPTKQYIGIFFLSYEIREKWRKIPYIFWNENFLIYFLRFYALHLHV